MRKSAVEIKITDLLAKSDFNPPQPWTKLVEITETIIDGEQDKTPKLVGFVFQGTFVGQQDAATMAARTKAIAKISTSSTRETIP